MAINQIITNFQADSLNKHSPSCTISRSEERKPRSRVSSKACTFMSALSPVHRPLSCINTAVVDSNENHNCFDCAHSSCHAGPHCMLCALSDFTSHDSSEGWDFYYDHLINEETWGFEAVRSWYSTELARWRECHFVKYCQHPLIQSTSIESLLSTKHCLDSGKKMFHREGRVPSLMGLIILVEEDGQ